MKADGAHSAHRIPHSALERLISGFHFWVGRLGQKRQRAAAVQNLADVRSGPVNAKRLGVRQPSGALERGNCQSECRRGNGARGLPCEIRRRQWEALAQALFHRAHARGWAMTEI